MFKTFLIIFLILAVVSISGGSFYYFEIYQPQAYAAFIISLYQKLEHIGLQPDTSSLKDKADYEGAFKILEQRIGLLESMQDELMRIQAPKRMVNVKKEFADYLAFLQTQHAHAIQLASFIKEASKLQDVIKDMYGQDTSEQNKIATMGDLQKKLNERIPRIQTAGEKMFNKEVTGLTNPSFTELHTLWENGNPFFDLMLKKIQAISPHIPLSQVGNLFNSSEEKQLNIYNKNLEEFTKKLDDLIKQHGAYDLLAFRDFPNISSREASERSLEFYQRIKTLKESYTQ